MTNKAGGGKLTPKTARVALAASRWTVPALLAFVFVSLVIAGAAVSPYLFQATTLEREIALQLRATTGLSMSSPTTGRFALLPRPHVILDALHVGDAAGGLTIDADGLDGDVRVLPLLVGRVELSSATLIRPRFRIDLGADPMSPESLIGRAVRSPGPVEPGDRQRLGTITTVDGTAHIDGLPSPKLRDLAAINVTLDWRDLESPATLSGSLSMHGVPTDVAAWIGRPSKLLHGDHSAVTFHLHADPLDVSANGDLVHGATTGFRGHLSGTTPSVPDLFGLLDYAGTFIAPFANVSLDSDLGLTIDPEAKISVDLAELKLRADGNEYEGTLAFQTAPRATLSGTLATEQLALNPFLRRMPALVDGRRAWSETPLLDKTPPQLDLDLRVSATHVRLTPVTIDDAAIAVITRADRTEIALVDGKAYGGTAKGRFSVGVADGTVDLRASGSLNDADAAALSWDVFGRQVATGSLSGSANVETSGSSPAALARGLQGWAKGSIGDGELSGLDVGRGLHEIERKKVAASQSALRNGRTPFQKLAVGGRIVDGIASLDEGALALTGAGVTLSGNVDIGRRAVDLHGDATPSGGGTGPHLLFDIGGPFDRPHMVPESASAPAAPTPESAAKTKAPPR